MDLFAVILFLANYYLKPQEWAGFLSTLRPVQLSILLGIVGLMNREYRPRLKDLWQTPHDLALGLFFLWVIFTSGAPYTTFKAVSNLIVFYIVIVQTLNTIQRLKIFLNWWCAFIVIIAVLAVSSEFGFDPLESYELTHGWMKDRLSLNLSIFNNPNALAHSVVPAIPMLYFLLLWKRNLFMKKIAVAAFAAPLYCIYLTVSKGAFLCGFVAMMATLTFGRPKVIQIVLLGLGFGFGYGALYMLPRMSELNKAKSDEAIQGRIAAYTYGYKCVTTLPMGIGYCNWMEGFFKQSRRFKIVKEHRRTPNGYMIVRHLVPEHYRKAAHGSYNQMGAELGFTGLALFFGMVWCSLRTLCTAKTADPEEERIRRLLFVLNVTYLVSSWMVDFGYRPTFFMFSAATAAFHRHLRGIYRETEREVAEESALQAIPAWKRRLRPAMLQGAEEPLAIEAVAAVEPSALSVAVAQSPAGLKPAQLTPSFPVKLRPIGTPDEVLEIGTIDWNRFGILEMTMPFVIAWAVVRFWHHILQTM